MPTGLIKYLELELFPCIQQKVTGQISIHTAHRWLHKEGFCYTEYKKVLYVDGHKQPDVVEKQQKKFIPMLDKLQPQLVEYYLMKEVEKEVDNLVECCLVPLAQDDMTAQANDDQKFGWYED
jgi:hypothetical protein